MSAAAFIHAVESIDPCAACEDAAVIRSRKVLEGHQYPDPSHTTMLVMPEMWMSDEEPTPARPG